MEELTRFVMLAKSGRFTVTDLCEQFGISRKTGHKYLERFAALGSAGLQPRGHRPKVSPQRTDENVESLILADRRLHRTWGPKKLQKGMPKGSGRCLWIIVEPEALQHFRRFMLCRHAVPCRRLASGAP
jgi:hypothetical protein